MMKNKFDVYSKDESLFYDLKMLTIIKLKKKKTKTKQATRTQENP